MLTSPASPALGRYGLIQFIVTAKKLLFITAGLMSGTTAFTKLFVCATLREDVDSPTYEPSYFNCETFAPGAHPTFPFEMALFIVRSFLLWVAFAMLWNFDAMIKAQRRRRRALAGQQRLTAGAERRGLYGPYLTGVLVLL